MVYERNNESELAFGELCRDFYYVNLLIDNIMVENISEVQRLLEVKQANPNTVVPEKGVAPLHLLAGLENEDFSSKITLQAILRNGGDPNIRSEEGLTPVHVAAMWGRCKVLEILLINGGDPELIDYKMFLNAEEYAIREQQWKAYRVLSTFSVIADGEGKIDRYFKVRSGSSEISSDFSNFSNNETRLLKNKHLLKLKDKAKNFSTDNSSSGGSENRTYSAVRKGKKINKVNHMDDDLPRDLNDQSKNTIKSLKLNLGALSMIRRQRRKTNTYESNTSSLDEDFSRYKHNSNPQKEKCSKFSSYGDEVSESCDWIRKSRDSVDLDENALNTIRNQRLSSRIYQTKGLGEDPLKPREKKAPLYEESETFDWVNPKNYETLDESSLNKINTHRTRATTYKSEDSKNPSVLTPGPKLPRRNKNKHHRKEEDSQMYLCSYAEESIRHNARQRRSQYLTSGFSDVNSSDFDERGIPNQKMLCKMSRIFLFMLKKRHIYQKIK